MFASKNFFRGFFTVVNQAEVAYREFFGRGRTLLQPGIRLQLPLVHDFYRVNLREQSSDIKKINACTRDNIPVYISGALFYRVVDPEKACFSINNYARSVATVGESSVRSIIGVFDYDKITSERNEINSTLRENIGKSTLEWGVDCTRFEIQEFVPQNASVQEQLLKQMEAERARRETELKTLAKIRESEGDAQKIKNEADAHAYSTRAKAEADAYARLRESESYSLQIDNFKKSGMNAESAANFLLEMNRVANLREIAGNKDGNVYFIPPEGMYPTMKVIQDRL